MIASRAQFIARKRPLDGAYLYDMVGREYHRPASDNVTMLVLLL